jgi:sn-glycerol 3-phosphate transport system substrate-binding protein
LLPYAAANDRDCWVAGEAIDPAFGLRDSHSITLDAEALEDGVQAVLSGNATPETAMDAVQKQADSLMKSYVEQTAPKLPE